jgi:RNA polymerase primary sigma factor
MRAIIDPAKHLGLAAMAAKKSAAIEGVPVQDSEAFGDACVALVRCSQRFDPERGYQFSTFALTSCLNAVMSGWYLRSGRRRKGFDEVNFVSIEATGDVAERGQLDSIASDRVEKVREAIAALPERKRFVIEQRMAGKLLSELGEVLGVSKERVRQIEEQCLSELRRLLSGVV